MMNGKQKFYFLLDAIVDANEITPSGRPLIIDPLRALNKNFSEQELSFMFIKLAEDKKVLKLIKAPQRVKSELEELDPYDFADDGCWHVELLPSFNRYFLEVQHESEYQDFTGKKPPTQAKTTLNRKSLEKIWTMMQEIENKRGITSIRDDISIQMVHMSKVKDERQAQDASDERVNILRKLENDDNAIKDVRIPNNFHEFVYLKVTDKFSQTYKEYEEAYKKSAKEYQEQMQPVGVSHNDLSLLHPDIFAKCQSLFEKAEYAEAVAKSFRVVKDRLRELTGLEKASDAFGNTGIHIKGASAQNVDADFNQGVKFLAMAIDMFRNEKSHTSDAKIDDPHRAYEYLALSSLAMNLLDQAEIKKS